jgi:hypothetical protein
MISRVHFLQPCLTFALLFTFAGCIAPAPWLNPPSNESTKAMAEKLCPSIAGIYSNSANPNQYCSSLDRLACSTLTFYLFSIHVREAVGVSNIPTATDDWPLGTHVQIVQPTADIIRIFALDRSDPSQPRILALRELSRHKGDFACESQAIRLKPRVNYDFALWFGRRTNTEYIEVRIEGEELVVKSTRHYSSYIGWLIGGTMREESSMLRWQKAKSL